MLKYRILQTANEKQIGLSFSTSNLDKKTIDEEDTYNEGINSIDLLEKESYMASDNYTITFDFYSGTYNSDFVNAGFLIPGDVSKNVFKKSLFLVEFYDALDTKTRKFSSSLSIYPNPKSGKGPVSTSTTSGITSVSSIYQISNILNEMYLIYNYRTFSNFPNILIAGGKEYSSMYMKIMFLNAKTGIVQYFIPAATGDQTTLSAGQFTDNLFYYEIRFFNDYTFSFYLNGIKQTNIYFKELVVI